MIPMFGLVEIVLLIIPAWVSNSVPVVLGGGPKIDGRFRAWDNRRVLGDSKTVNGFLSGITFGTAVGAVAAASFGNDYLPMLGVSQKVGLAVLLAFGAMAGDLLGSFIKRRRGQPPGYPSLVLDKLLFLYVALAIALAAYPALWGAIGWDGLAFLTVATYALHVSFNWIAHYALRVKRVPW